MLALYCPSVNKQYVLLSTFIKEDKTHTRRCAVREYQSSAMEHACRRTQTKFTHYIKHRRNTGLWQEAHADRNM